MEIKRMQIYMGNLAEPPKEGEKKTNVQRGKRPVLIISNDECNIFSPVVVVLPLTKQAKKDKQPTKVFLEDYAKYGLSCPSVIMAEQIMTIDKTMLGRYMGEIKDQGIQDEIESAIEVEIKDFSEREALRMHNNCNKMLKIIRDYQSKGIDTEDLEIIYNSNKKEFFDYCKMFKRDPKEVVSSLKNKSAFRIAV